MEWYIHDREIHVLYSDKSERWDDRIATLRKDISMNRGKILAHIRRALS